MIGPSWFGSVTHCGVATGRTIGGSREIIALKRMSRCYTAAANRAGPAQAARRPLRPEFRDIWRHSFRMVFSRSLHYIGFTDAIAVCAADDASYFNSLSAHHGYY